MCSDQCRVEQPPPPSPRGTANSPHQEPLAEHRSSCESHASDAGAWCAEGVTRSGAVGASISGGSRAPVPLRAVPAHSAFTTFSICCQTSRVVVQEQEFLPFQKWDVMSYIMAFSLFTHSDSAAPSEAEHRYATALCAQAARLDQALQPGALRSPKGGDSCGTPEGQQWCGGTEEWSSRGTPEGSPLETAFW